MEFRRVLFPISVLGLGAVFSQTASAAALKVFACESEWGALLQELGGDHLDVYVATSALQDVHKIQPRPSLIAKYRQADLVVCTGSELDRKSTRLNSSH